jgi:hypothetical protein
VLTVNECRRNARGCLKQAAEATDPMIKESLSETAQGWARLAADLANINDRAVVGNLQKQTDRRQRAGDQSFP